MLLQFKCKNHKSFYDEMILDLTATSEANHKSELLEKNGNYVLPVINIYGANASGKSNIFDAIWYMSSLVVYSLNNDLKEDLATFPFCFSNKSLKENSEYEVSIAVDDTEYRYGFTLNSNNICEEWFYSRPFNSKSVANDKIIFERNMNVVKFASKYNNYQKLWNLNSKELKCKILVSSFLGNKEVEGPFRTIYDFMSKTIIKKSMYLERKEMVPLENNTKFKKDIMKIIRESDPFLSDVEFIPILDTNPQQYHILGVHNIDGKTVKIAIENESTGTIKMLRILPLIINSLEEGTIACVDELDIHFHSLLFKKIVFMFKDKKINKKGAQLIFSSHGTILLNTNDMRRDEVYFTEKNENGKSSLYSLADFKNLRIDSDYEKRYLSGKFGGIPFSE